jgi:hypothetical protein
MPAAIVARLMANRAGHGSRVGDQGSGVREAASVPYGRSMRRPTEQHAGTFHPERSEGPLRALDERCFASLSMTDTRRTTSENFVYGVATCKYEVATCKYEVDTCEYEVATCKYEVDTCKYESWELHAQCFHSPSLPLSSTTFASFAVLRPVKKTAQRAVSSGILGGSEEGHFQPTGQSANRRGA